MRRAFVTIVVGLFGLVFASLAVSYTEQHALRPLAESYVKLVPHELGAPNVITGILLTYRGFDTLGEVAVLFMVAAGVGLVLGTRRARGAKRHLGPSQRGPAVHRNRANWSRNSGSAHLDFRGLYHHEWPPISGWRLSGRRRDRLGRFADISGFPAISARSRIPQHYGIRRRRAVRACGIAGLIMAGGFLDNRILPLGQFGAFFSAGAIPLLSVLLGIKVGCELSVILERFRAKSEGRADDFDTSFW